jgi:hypothetical protein
MDEKPGMSTADRWALAIASVVIILGAVFLCYAVSVYAVGGSRDEHGRMINWPYWKVGR